MKYIITESRLKVARANPIYNKKLGKPISSPSIVGDMKQYYQKVKRINIILTVKYILTLT